VNMTVVSLFLVPITVFALYYLYKVTVVALQSNIVELQSSGAQLSATATQSASTAAEQAGIVAQVSTTVEEISQTSSVGADGAQGVVSVTSEAVKKGQKGQLSIKEALSVMSRIGQVSAIVDVVNQLAEQSNLLAVNAGIEAAKAGDQGRGFAVVATEVRNLAEQSRKATLEIREALRLTDDGRRAIEATSAVIEELMVVLEDASDRSRQIAGAAMQQAAGLKQISEATLSLKQASQDSAAAAKQIEEAVGSLETVGGRMRRFVGEKKGEKHVAA
jgi:methyl-accepting chemotaxis protein